jgi:hypothetical protein
MIKLNVGERLMVISVLPKEGSYVTIKMIRGLIEKLGLSAQEIKDFEVKEVDGNVRWNSQGAIPIQVDFVDTELEIIRKQLRRLDTDQKLHPELMVVYEKFCM